MTSTGNEMLMSESELINYIDQFQKEAENLLEQALNTHRGFSKPGVPYIIWIILAFFAYDDILVYI